MNNMKHKILMTLALLLMAVTGAWAADTYTITFSANGKNKTYTDVVLPAEYKCEYGSPGKFDNIIQELYEQDGGHGIENATPTVTGTDAITPGLDGPNNYAMITITAPFTGKATVSGTYAGWSNKSGNSDINYSIEVYCKNSSALPSPNARPIGFLNAHGFGIQMNNRGNVGFLTATLGNKADGSFAKTLWSWTQDGILTTDYTHYVLVFDRLNFSSKLYINGELAGTRWLTFKECPIYEWTPSTWLGIGGDTKGTYDAATTLGSYPFIGDIAMVRIYGRALKKTEVQSLAGIAGNQERSFTLGYNGYVAVCLPYVWQVPEGCP